MILSFLNNYFFILEIKLIKNLSIQFFLLDLVTIFSVLILSVNISVLLNLFFDNL